MHCEYLSLSSFRSKLWSQALLLQLWKTIRVNTIICVASLMSGDLSNSNEKHTLIKIIAKLVRNILTHFI